MRILFSLSSIFASKNSCFPFFQLSSFLVVSKKTCCDVEDENDDDDTFSCCLKEHCHWRVELSTAKIVSLLFLKVPTLETWVKAHLFWNGILCTWIIYIEILLFSSLSSLVFFSFKFFFCRCCSSFTHSHPHPLFHPSMPSNHNDDDDDDVVVAFAAASVQKGFTYDMPCFLSLFFFFSKE